MPAARVLLALVCSVLLSSPVSGQVTIPLRPKKTLTPGARFPVTKADVCVAGYSKKVRNVTQARKDSAFAEYGILHHVKGQYEVDHLISLELGGSNSLRNLWPQSYETKPWNAFVKDKLENALHREVCAGELSLAAAQREIATNWIAAYKKHIGPVP